MLAASASTPTVYQWQWNGSAPFEDIVHWCRCTFGYAAWTTRDINFYFVHEEDYTFFLLRWK